MEGKLRSLGYLVLAIGLAPCLANAQTNQLSTEDTALDSLISTAASNAGPGATAAYRLCGFLFAGKPLMPADQNAIIQNKLDQIKDTLSSIETSLSNLKGSVDHISCQIDQVSYQLTTVDTIQIATKIAEASPMLQDAFKNPQNGATDATQIQELFAGDDWTDTSWTSMHDDIYNLVAGAHGAAPVLNKFSNSLTSCHTYFNYNDSQLLRAEWARLLSLQTHACILEVSLHQMHASQATTITDAQAALTRRNQVISDCQTYLQNVLSLKPEYFVSDPNEVVDTKSMLAWQLDTSGPSSGMYANTCKKAFIPNGVNDDDQGTTEGDWMTYCTIPGKGQSGAPWQTLPYYRDINTFLNDSDCVGASGDLVKCLNAQGFPVPGYPPFQIWANSSPYFGVYTTSTDSDERTEYNDNSDFYDYEDLVKRWGAYISPQSSINPPCWVYGWDTTLKYTTHWQCGLVNVSSAGGINQGGDPMAAWYLRPWVGRGAADGASGAAVSGFWWDDASFATAKKALAVPATVDDVTLNALTISGGNNQTATAIGSCRFYCFDPLSVTATNSNGRPQSGIPVTFTCQSSCLFPNGYSSITVTTDNTGAASTGALQSYAAGTLTVIADGPNIFRPATFTETIAPKQ